MDKDRDKPNTSYIEQTEKLRAMADMGTTLLNGDVGGFNSASNDVNLIAGKGDYKDHSRTKDGKVEHDIHDEPNCDMSNSVLARSVMFSQLSFQAWTEGRPQFNDQTKAFQLFIKWWCMQFARIVDMPHKYGSVEMNKERFDKKNQKNKKINVDNIQYGLTQIAKRSGAEPKDLSVICEESKDCSGMGEIHISDLHLIKKEYNDNEISKNSAKSSRKIGSNKSIDVNSSRKDESILNKGIDECRSEYDTSRKSVKPQKLNYSNGNMENCININNLQLDKISQYGDTTSMLSLNLSSVTDCETIRSVMENIEMLRKKNISNVALHFEVDGVEEIEFYDTMSDIGRNQIKDILNRFVSGDIDVRSYISPKKKCN